MKELIITISFLITGTYALFSQDAPSIINHPSSGNKCIGDDIILSVTASGEGPLTYQWFKDEVLLTDEENATLVLTDLASDDSGLYHCEVSNAFGSTPSNPAQLTVSVDIPAAMTVSSLSISMCQGTSNTLSVPGGELGVNYSWFRNDIHVGNSPVYNISSASAIDAGDYYCYAFNACGDRYSDTIAIEYIQSPNISVAPQNQTVCEGENATFTAEATGDYLYYKWLRNGAMIAGEFTTSLTIESLSFPSSGDQYQFIAYNVCNVAGDTSNIVYIFVNNLPQITGHPISATECLGSEINLYATAGSSTPVTYQWYDSEGLLSDENSVQLTINVEENGNFYYCEFSNICGTVNSDTAYINAIVPISFTQHPNDTTVCSGEDVNLLVKIDGSEPFYYQWLLNDVNVYGDNVSGANSDDLFINEIYIGQQGVYTCFVWNECGSATSNPANVVVNTMPELYTQPLSNELCEGEELEIDFIYNGSEPLHFEWFRLSDVEAVSTSAALYFPHAGPDLSDDYFCIVSNSCGVISTDTITISVLSLPEIINQPVGANLCAGNPLSLEIVAEGSEPMTYLWYRNESALTAETSPLIYYDEATIAHTGSYFCMIFNECATIYSDTVFVNVGTSPIITWNPINKNLCELDSLNLLMSAAGDNFSVQWYHNESPVIGANDTLFSIVSVLQANQGYYYAKAFNACDTVFTDTVFVQVSPAPELELGDDIHACNGELIILAPVGDYVHYNWNNGLSNQPSIEVILSGTFILEVTGENSCKNRDTIVVEFHPYHDIVFNPEPTISCGPLMLDAGEGAHSYVWSTGVEDVHYITVTEDGTYSVTVTGDWFGCESTAYTNVEIREPINISLGPDQSAPVNSFVNIGIEATFAEYLWNTGFTGPNLSVFGSEYGEGHHEFWLTAWAANGCHDTDTIVVTFTPASNVDENSASKNINIYPIPASDYIIFEKTGKEADYLEIININGQTLIAEAINNYGKIRIDVSDLADGIYFVRLYNKNISFAISKIIIQK